MFKKLFLLLTIVGLSIVLLLPEEKVKAFEATIFSASDIQNYKASKPFNDIPLKSNYYHSTHMLRDLSIINGYPDGSFKPQNSITRRQAALLINRLESEQYIKVPSVREGLGFKDVNWGDEAYNGLSSLYQAGILERDKKGNIFPNEKLTRGEMAKILVIGFNLDISSNTGSFKDVAGKPIEPYVETLLAYGITTGYEDGSFKPQISLSRAHYSEFIFRVLKKFGENVYTGDQTQNVSKNFISNTQTRWAENLNSFIINSANDTYTTVDVSDKLTIQKYSNDYKVLSTKKLPLELPMFGTFYSGEKYHYIAYGQENPEQNNQKEVIRIVKYDRDFNRVDSLSIQGGDIYTTVPFDAGVGRMAEANGTLVYHTSREQYKSEDGSNHQSQLTFVIDTNTMRVLNDTSEFQKNHVSHSFNQFVLFDGNEHVLLDHGDAYPRSIVLNKGVVDSYQEKDIVDIPGPIGANQTGVSLGGFEQSTNNYLVLYNEIDHKKAMSYDSFKITGVDSNRRDIKVAAVSKDLSNISLNQLATYTNTEKQIASLPTLVKISDDEFVVLWQEFDHKSVPKYLKYVKVNGQGQAISEIQSKERMYLSYMQPTYANGKISWYVNQNNSKYFFSLDVSNL